MAMGLVLLIWSSLKSPSLYLKGNEASLRSKITSYPSFTISMPKKVILHSNKSLQYSWEQKVKKL